eukprot:CAMPEP_0206263868 /NCGR_PEP_ID=MMETSP0047_2-20121206/29071_1 /ASSEMBLY_ACC=CAM_ASM_000192 /TAXON_ID=195065 /ORGANISM="Chroomonas mesostigmatica_cf, Strain CCMP1168" /LENGTH=64 /DNA_ID=CAMNT_0053691485 /DNA_START=97 /DNA_END=288 /DNA_ORIENTATION=-
MRRAASSTSSGFVAPCITAAAEGEGVACTAEPSGSAMTIDSGGPSRTPRMRLGPMALLWGRGFW